MRMKRRAVTCAPIDCVESENHSDNVTNPNGSEGKLLFDLIFNLISLILILIRIIKISSTSWYLFIYY